MTRKALFALMALAPLAGACADLQESLGRGEIGIREAAWMKPEITPRPPSLYCYRTLGQQDCYRLPQPQEQPRLIESYGPPPDASSP